MDTNILSEIGMTPGEKRIYLAMLDLGESSTGAIISKGNVTSSKVYLILERLEQKGLISHVIKNNIKYFQLADPERILDYLHEKKKKIEQEEKKVIELIPFLKEKTKQKQTIQETKMYKGYEGLKTAIYEFAFDLKKGEEYVVFGAASHFGEAFENFIRNFYLEKESKGIKTRLIYNSSFKDVRKIYQDLKLVQIRFIDIITPSTIAISKRKILINSYGDNAMHVIISNEAIAQSFYSFFESMWKIAHK